MSGEETRLTTYSAPAPPAISGPAGWGEDQGPDTATQVRRYVGAVWRRKWLVLLGAVLGGVAGWFGSRFVEPEYAVEARIWVEADSRAIRDRGPIRAAELLRSEGWVELLSPGPVLDSVVMSERLFVEPAVRADAPLFQDFALDTSFRPGGYRLVVGSNGSGFTLSTSAGVVLERGALGDSVGRSLGFLWLPPAGELQSDRRLEFAVFTPREASRRLAGSLNTRVGRDGSFLHIELTGPDPERIARVLNGITDRFVDQAAELKRAMAQQLTELLEEQVLYAESELRQAEYELEQFRVATIALPAQPASPVAPGLAETRNPVFARFFDMNIQRDQIRRDRESLQAAQDVLASGATVPILMLETIPAVQSSMELNQTLSELTALRAELRALGAQYSEEHAAYQRLASMVQRLEEETIPSMLSRLAAALAGREQELDRTVESAAQELGQIPPRAIEEGRLVRRQAIAENLYMMLRQRFEEARLTAVTTVPDVRLYDRAVPPRFPSRDGRFQLLLLAIGGGFGLAVLGSLLLERTDQHVRYPEHVSVELGLPLLGAVPRLMFAHRNRPEQVEQVVEAFRTLRLNLLAAVPKPPLVVAVGSAGPAEGKSFISVNLALAFAVQGHTVLLIDGDTRRGELHRLLDRERMPGLTDYLAGEAARETLVQDAGYERLAFIGGGRRRERSPEMLGSEEMAGLINKLKQQYEVIIVDTPPLAAGVDAYTLGRYVDGLLMVVRNGVTERELATMKLEMADRLGIRIFGAVLNDVPAKGVYRYYGYTPGYGLNEEPDAKDAARTPNLLPAQR